MFQWFCRFSIGVAFLVALLSPAPGQDDNRRFFKKPETAAEFWRAVQLEIDLGKFDLAADFLKGFAAKKPSDEELLQLEEKYGISSFLRLLTVPKWVDDPKQNAEVKKEAEQVVERVSEVVRKHLADPGRIDKFIKNLSASPEERSYAIAQLRRSGAAAVPQLIDALQKSADDPAVHTQILSTIPRLSKDAVPPLLAALDISDPNLKYELLDALHRRHEMSAIPELWYLAGSPKQSEPVRKKATAMLGGFQSVEAGRLPSAKAALTKEAERYYQHREKFINPAAVTVWRWDGKQLVSQVVPASKAEEYYGLRYARQALDIDPAYQPAQVMFLSIALDKGYERTGLDQPLRKGAPEVKQLLSTVNPQIVYAVLQQGLRDRRIPVILGAVKALGELREPGAGGTSGQEASALIQALYFPDRRVQFAAAEAVLQLPGLPDVPATRVGLPAMPAKARVVEVLRRTSATDTAPRALVAYNSEDQGNAIAAAVKQAGFDAVVVNTGRAALRRLNEAADIDVLLLDAALPDPGLPNLLAQLRTDVNVGLLPIILTAPSGQIDHLQRLTAGYRNITVQGATSDPAALKRVLGEQINAAMGQPLAEAERKKFAEDAMQWLKRIATGEVHGYDVRPAASAILEGLRSNDLAAAGAIEAASRLPGRDAQFGLATLVLTADRPAPLRAAAAVELVRSIRQRGMLLTKQQTEALQQLAAAEKNDDVRDKVALVVGNLRPPSARSGEVLRGYSPPLEAPAAAIAPPPKEEAKEKKEESKEK